MGIDPMETLDEITLNAGRWLTVKQLAEKYKVHPQTIRDWADKGLIKHVRHPMNQYRLFLETDFLKVHNHE